jgi:hypothetical protein
MPFARIPAAEQATGRDKRRIAAVIAAIGLILAAVAIWATVRPGVYDGSRDGCITVNLPSSMGGSLMHQCGGAARTTCQHAYAGTNEISRLTRPQCRLAGIDPS